jgi:hypothetical protein
MNPETKFEIFLSQSFRFHRIFSEYIPFLGQKCSAFARTESSFPNW